MIEVETKVSIHNPEYWRGVLRKRGRFVGRQIKIDEYWTLQRKGYPHKSLRIRHQQGYYEVNFKHWLSFDKGVFAKNEVEFNVSDVKGFIELIKDFGYRKWLGKEKNCEIFEISRNFHVELNYVKGLGWFLEIEYLVSDKSDVDRARRAVAELIREFGFKERDVVKEGYTKLLWKKMGK